MAASENNAIVKRSDREDSGLGDEAVANVDVARGEGDVALTTICVTLVPDNILRTDPKNHFLMKNTYFLPNFYRFVHN